MKTLAVITRVGDPERGGNLANAPELYVESEAPSEANDWTGTYRSFWKGLAEGLGEDKSALLALAGIAYPVFQLGEILVLDEDDRTIPDGRKPSKWDVDYETCATVEEAAALSRRVTATAREGVRAS